MPCLPCCLPGLVWRLEWVVCVWVDLDWAIWLVWFGLVYSGWSGLVWTLSWVGGWFCLLFCRITQFFYFVFVCGTTTTTPKTAPGIISWRLVVVSCRCGPGWEQKGLLYLPALRTSTERSREDRILYLLHCGPRHRGRERIADHMAVAIATLVL